jgi:hypothetical protein
MVWGSFEIRFSDGHSILPIRRSFLHGADCLYVMVVAGWCDEKNNEKTILQG